MMKKLFVPFSIIAFLFCACNFEALLPKEKIVYVTAEQPATSETKQTQETSQQTEQTEQTETEKSQADTPKADTPRDDTTQSETPASTQTGNDTQTTETSENPSPTNSPDTTDTPVTSNSTQPPTEETPPDNTQQTNTQTSDSEPTVTQDPGPDPEPTDPVPDTPAKLTLIVYMAADNDLEQYAIENLKDMEYADFENINVLALLDRAEGYDETNGNWTDTRLFEVLHDDTNSGLLVSKRLDCPPLGLSARLRTELDMGNYNVLKNLINFAKSEYEAEQYALIIWGHGTGWRYSNPNSFRAVGIDEKTDSFMTVCDLGKALKNQDLAAIGFDTCFGGVFENLYELQYSAEYVVASPGVSPSSGWNYKNLLETISQRDVSASDLANLMAENSPVHTTVLNTSRIQTIMNALEEFSENLAGTITNSTTRNSAFNTLFNAKSYSYTQYPCDMYIDIFDVANTYAESENVDLAESAEKLKTAISRAGHTTNSRTVEIGLHLIPLRSAHTANYYHSADYLKDPANMTQGAFIKESNWWVPTKNNDSGSVLDKIFYQ